MKERFNSALGGVITFEWLEKELSSFNEHLTYFVFMGFYDRWDHGKDQKSPNLEEILNFMDKKGFCFVSLFPMGNPSCKELVFKRKQKIESKKEEEQRRNLHYYPAYRETIEKGNLAAYIETFGESIYHDGTHELIGYEGEGISYWLTLDVEDDYQTPSFLVRTYSDKTDDLESFSTFEKAYDYLKKVTGQ